MKHLKNLLSAVLAGVMISFGGAVFLACENKIVGALLFSLGLTVILLNGFLLFTGKTAYLFENKPSYILLLCLIWVGNILGCMGMGALVGYAKPALAETASTVCTTKLTQLPLQTIGLGALCGILVYIAVDFFKSDDDKKAFNKYLIVFTAIPAFIICGFEHSVADMFYLATSGDLYTGKGIVYILLVTAGNLVGAVIFHVIRKFVTAKAK
ncbi:MAG: formate/nitrite transporter family protein [Ruminococcus sp.]|nr:formate/nitrite transporter family protein [Ruminococcus sp.]MBQ9514724.1 formate/nitrite transporter family protein [Ruminococcus sp.]